MFRNKGSFIFKIYRRTYEPHSHDGVAFLSDFSLKFPSPENQERKKRKNVKTKKVHKMTQ